MTKWTEESWSAFQCTLAQALLLCRTESSQGVAFSSELLGIHAGMCCAAAEAVWCSSAEKPFELTLQPMIMQIGSAGRGEAAGVTAATCETLLPGYCFHYSSVLCSYSDSEVSDSSLISSLGKPLLQ